MATLSAPSSLLSALHASSKSCTTRARIQRVNNCVSRPGFCKLGKNLGSSLLSGSSRVLWRSVSRSGSLASSGRGSRRRLVVSAIFEHFTERAIKAVILAQSEAKAMGRAEVEVEHMLIGLVAEEVNAEGFYSTGVKPEIVREAVRGLFNDGMLPLSFNNFTPSEKIPFSKSSKRAFETALNESRRLKNNFIAPEHLVIALLSEEVGTASLIFERLGISKEKILTEAKNRLHGELASEGRLSSPPSSEPPPKSSSSQGYTFKRGKSSLNDFCTDITAQAANGDIDPLIGRDKEVERLVEILARRTKNNPILIGEPGVGKTAIAEGLALRIVQNKVPDFLSGKTLLALNLSFLLAGTKERGELENRVTQLMKEVISSGNIILFIDEVHNLVGMGSVGRNNSSSGLDIANIFKPALAKGQFQCIGATTYDEHRKHIEKDKALARRFQPVYVHEPSQDGAIEILKGLKEKYERFHKCHITDEAIRASVEYSSKYIADRYLPDKAIDLIDEAGSKARINAFRERKARLTSVLYKPADEYWREIRGFHDRAASMLALNNNQQDLDFYDLSLLNSNANFSSSSTFDQEVDEGPVVVDVQEIAAVASKMSGVPIERLTEGETQKLQELEKVLQSRVIGQDDAVLAVGRAVKRARLGIKDENRPIAAMLFCGPVGVGKTELTKKLAEHYFGSPSSLIRLDMSECMERHSVSKLIGSPPGYVGYGEGGNLTEKVRRNPFSLVLLDEIEKAHPDVFNLLLQMFEDGRLTDSQGRSVSFKNCMIIMTSNVGSEAIMKGRKNQMGFTLANDLEEERYSNIKSVVMDELKNFFRPELLNRIDEVVVFRPLQKSQVSTILDIMLSETKERLSKQHISLEVSDALVQKICNEGYDQRNGARPLRRALASHIEDVLAEARLKGEIADGDTALLDLGFDGKVTLTCFPKPDPCEYNMCISNLKISAHSGSSASSNFFE